MSILAGSKQLSAATDALKESSEVLIHVDGAGTIDAREIQLYGDESPICTIHGWKIDGNGSELWVFRVADIRSVEIKDRCDLPSLLH